MKTVTFKEEFKDYLRDQSNKMSQYESLSSYYFIMVLIDYLKIKPWKIFPQCPTKTKSLSKSKDASKRGFIDLIYKSDLKRPKDLSIVIEMKTYKGLSPTKTTKVYSQIHKYIKTSKPPSDGTWCIGIATDLKYVFYSIRRRNSKGKPSILNANYHTAHEEPEKLFAEIKPLFKENELDFKSFMRTVFWDGSPDIRQKLLCETLETNNAIKEKYFKQMNFTEIKKKDQKKVYHHIIKKATGQTKSRNKLLSDARESELISEFKSICQKYKKEINELLMKNWSIFGINLPDKINFEKSI